MKKKTQNLKRIAAAALASVLIFSNFGDISKVKAEEVKIQTDVPDLKDVLTEKLGEDFLTGASLCVGDLSDVNEMALVTKHFNAVTFGNELKPDSMFGYSNNSCPGKTTAVLNGKEIVVPVTDFSRGEKLLEYFYKWNEEHPEDQIKIRGHVLTWHSQTPEWFFHEDYDASKPYVTPEEMTIRHEWYIKTVLEHFAGEDSKYKDMFYGWDVVNEAVSDGTGTYRNDNENSSWWAVYHSNEFIINAFRFANKYAPASIELYYNDYNECSSSKSEGIAQLLKDVKEAEGTRIDAFGMQGHYHTNEDNPSVDDFKKVAKKYSDIVGKVQVTELDFQCSSTYDGTKDTYDSEDFKLGLRYLEFFNAIQELQKEGVKFGTVTVWGVVDKYSWLQSRSNVGGGANGTKKQMPLLFNDDYQVKQAYWAFVDTSMLAYPIQECEVMQTLDLTNDKLNKKLEDKISFSDENTKVEFRPLWNLENKVMKVYVSVEDKSEDANDEVAIYYDNNGSIEKTVVKRSDADKSKNGYETTIEIPLNENVLFASSVIRFDMVVTNGDTKLAYSDKGLKQEEDIASYAFATLKVFTTIPKGTISVDGEMEDLWYSARELELNISGSNTKPKSSATAKLLWDDENLYVYFDVTDADLNSKDSKNEQQDSVEIFIDEKNQKSHSYQTDDKQYRVSYLNDKSFNGENATDENIVSSVKLTDTGYVVEAAIKWTHIKAFHNMQIGLNLQINDANNNGERQAVLNWSDTNDLSYMDTSVFGTALLGDEAVTLSQDEINAIKATEAEKKPVVEEKNFFQKLLEKIKGLFKK